MQGDYSAMLNSYFTGVYADTGSETRGVEVFNMTAGQAVAINEEYID